MMNSWSLLAIAIVGSGVILIGIGQLYRTVQLDALQRRIDQRLREACLTNDKPDSRHLYSDTHKITEVTEKWHSEHHKIAKELGIGG